MLKTYLVVAESGEGVKDIEEAKHLFAEVKHLLGNTYLIKTETNNALGVASYLNADGFSKVFVVEVTNQDWDDNYSLDFEYTKTGKMMATTRRKNL